MRWDPERRGSWPVQAQRGTRSLSQQPSASRPLLLLLETVPAAGVAAVGGPRACSGAWRASAQSRSPASASAASRASAARRPRASPPSAASSRSHTASSSTSRRSAFQACAPRRGQAPPPRPPGSARGGTCSWSRVSAHCASVVIALPGPLETRWAASMRFCARAVLLASPDEAALPQAQGMSQSTRRGRLCTDHGTDTVPTTAGDWLYASTALPHAHLQTPPWRCQPPARLGDVGHARGAEELERLAQQALAVLWQDLHACTSTQYSATY